jgi:Domain of unknown function (DUF1929)/Kelch motif
MRWITLPQDSVDLAIHVALVHTGQAGQILLFSGDQHDPVRSRLGNVAHTQLFDCATLTMYTPPPPSPAGDVFCCGHAFLPDGQLLLMGGTEDFPQYSPPPHQHIHFTGLRRAQIFDPVSRTWSDVPDMTHGRWYPTATTLLTGDVLVLAGHSDGADRHHYNNRPELWRFGTRVWELKNEYGLGDGPPLFYPRVHVLPHSSEVFAVTSVNNTPGVAQVSTRYDPFADIWTPIPSAPVPAGYDSFAITSVMLPLTPENRYRPRVLICGGRDAYLIDLAAEAPSWQPSPRVWPDGDPPPRINVNAVLLPTGDVIAVGGTSIDADYPRNGVLYPELYTPDFGPDGGPGQWQRLEASATYPRGYHSVALLMPDGRVWVSGSQKPEVRYSFHNPYPDGLPHPPDADEPGVDNRELHIEIFEPDYVSQPRPEIIAAPETILVGQEFTIHTPQARAIQRVALIRTGSVTHSFNFDQRYVGLSFRVDAEDYLTVQGPPNTMIAPPGYYLLFILDSNQIPSVGRFLHIAPPA